MHLGVRAAHEHVDLLPHELLARVPVQDPQILVHVLDDTGGRCVVSKQRTKRFMVCARVRVSCARARVVCIPFLVDGDDGFHFLCDLIDLAHEDDLIALPPLVYLQTIPSTSLDM